jgi:hypothetical protein
VCAAADIVVEFTDMTTVSSVAFGCIANHLSS